MISPTVIVVLLLILFCFGFLYEINVQKIEINQLKKQEEKVSLAIFEIGLVLGSILKSLPDETVKKIDSHYTQLKKEAFDEN